MACVHDVARALSLDVDPRLEAGAQDNFNPFVIGNLVPVCCGQLGGGYLKHRSIYFLAKVGATDGKSFQQMAGSMTGLSEEQYRDMMVKGGRSADGNRYLGEQGDAQPKDRSA